MNESTTTVEKRIRNAGCRKAQVLQALYHEYGNITARAAADVIGVSYQTMYRDAAKAGLIMRKGMKPILRETA